MGNFTINALSSQGSQRSLDKAGRVLENSELHCSALLTSCSRLLKLTAYVFGTTRRLVDGSVDCQFRKTNARRQKWTALIAFHGCAEVEINVRLEELAGLSGIWSMPLPTCLRADWNL